MENAKDEYRPVTSAFRNLLTAYKAGRNYISIHYFSDLHEYIYTTAIIKEVYTRDGEPFILLNTDEAIRLDRIVRIDGTPAPGYNIDDFTCDC